MNNAAIQLSHLHYRYNPGRIILKDITFSIAENEFMAIIGQNGSGKTTLLKNISGLLRPSQGNILIRGKNTADMDIAEIAEEIGFVMQDPDRQLFESSVYDEAAFALKRTVSQDEIKIRVEQALSMTGLMDKRDAFPPALNRADRVKTVFASILAMGPRIIMLDEPFAGQDMRGCRLIMDTLANLYRQGYTIVIITHNINIIAGYVRRLMIIKDGQVFMDGKPGDIFERTAELSGAGILPPQITQLSQALRKRLPLEKTALTPAELAAMLVHK